VAFLSANGVSIFPDGHIPYSPSPGETIHEAQVRWVRTWRPDLVIGADRWDLYSGDSDGFEGRIRRLVGEFAAHTSRIVLVSQVPALPVGEIFNLREFVAYQRRKHGELPVLARDVSPTSGGRAAEIIERVARDEPRLRLLRPEGAFYNSDGSVRYAIGRSFLYADDDHLSDAGAEFVRPALEAEIREACVR
jgi:hypothetical protein